jgi:sugar transferase EpsL
VIYTDRGKRLLDLVVGAVLSVIALPAAILVGLMVRRNLGSPVLFRQQRPGLGGRLFCLYKFRTMRDDRLPSGELMSDEERLPPFGRWLRSTSLDEIPELWNVLRGDMSLVGPRPLLPEYLERYSPEQARRHEVRPGMTGWAQIHGRNELPWEDRLALDVWYVDHRSLWLDVRILARTVWTVLIRKGIRSAGHATSPRFGEHQDR